MADYMADYVKPKEDIHKIRSHDKVKESKYYKKWFNKFFYEHNVKDAKANLQKFFCANAQGLSFINYTYDDVVTQYLNKVEGG